MELSAWLNYLSPDGPCFDPSVLPIPGSPVSLSMIDAICEDYTKDAVEGPIQVLEIGCFVGISTIAWGNVLKNLSISDWNIMCCDTWYHSLDSEYKPDETIIKSRRNSFNHEIFKFNVRKSIGFEHVIEVIGDSRKTLPVLRESSCDIIYVDGYHGYTVAASDVREALRICRPGGIICGDDYDCTPDILARMPHDQFEEDGQIIDGHGFHAGISRAVNELLGEPKCFGSFWAFRKEKNGVTPIDANDLPRRIPSFIPERLHAWFNDHLNAPRGMPLGHPFAQRDEINRTNHETTTD